MYSVVILDDEPRICESIRLILETNVPELSRIAVFQDGQEAFDYLSANRADVLLLDIEVPGRSGLEIARMVRRQNVDSCIFIITAYRDFEYAQQAIHCSVNGFLTKPFSSKQLIDAVQQAISHFREKTSSEEEQRRADRSLLRSLCRAGTAPGDWDDLCFCQKTVPLKQLACTEIAFTNVGFDAVPAQLLPNIEEKLICAAESDTKEQTTLLTELTPERVLVLALSKGDPDLSFVAALSDIIAAHTGCRPSCARRTYAGFESYQEQLSFEREMAVFFDLLADGSASQAKKYLAKRVRSFSPAQTRAFSEFLGREYHAESTPDDEGISQALDQIIQSQLNRDTGNFTVESAKRYMQQHFSDASLSLTSMANALYVSSAYLSRLFKKINDTGFKDYLLKLRMERAQELLSTTSMPTVDVAKAVGYEDVSYFRLSFKGYFGMTPSRYRQVQNNWEEGEP